MTVIDQWQEEIRQEGEKNQAEAYPEWFPAGLLTIPLVDAQHNHPDSCPGK